MEAWEVVGQIRGRAETGIFSSFRVNLASGRPSVCVKSPRSQMQLRQDYRGDDNAVLAVDGLRMSQQTLDNLIMMVDRVRAPPLIPSSGRPDAAFGAAEAQTCL